MKKYNISLNQIALGLLVLFFSISFILSVIQLALEYKALNYTDLIINVFFLFITFLIISNLCYLLKINYILNSTQTFIFIIFKIITLTMFLLNRGNMNFYINKFEYALYILNYIQNISILMLSILYLLFFNFNFLENLNIYMYKNIKTQKINKNHYVDAIPYYSVIVELDKKINVSDSIENNVAGPLTIKIEDLCLSNYVIAVINKKAIGMFELNDNLKGIIANEKNWNEIKKALNIYDSININQVKNKCFLNIKNKNIIHTFKFSTLYNKRIEANKNKYFYDKH